MCQNPGERSVLHPDYFNAYVKHYILPYFPSISRSPIFSSLLPLEVLLHSLNTSVAHF